MLEEMLVITDTLIQLFICDLFNGVVISSDYVESNYRMISE
jgi:hypothetical protein